MVVGGFANPTIYIIYEWIYLIIYSQLQVIQSPIKFYFYLFFMFDNEKYFMFFPGFYYYYYYYFIFLKTKYFLKINKLFLYITSNSFNIF